jgi:hypothetical protein
MKKDTPSAEIRGAIRGALRSGRYANRSITTPSTPHAAIAAQTRSVISTQTATLGDSAPPSQLSVPQPTKAPTIITSPCAKLRSLRIP